MTNYTYRIGFAASQLIPPDRAAIVEVTTTFVFTYIDLHELFVEALTEWTRETREGQGLVSSIDEPLTVGAILMGLDSLTITSLEFWLSQSGMNGFRVMTSDAVFDLDLLIDE